MSEVIITWLGQATFVIQVQRERLLIDPFFTPHEARLYPPPTLESVADSVEHVLITHEHLDHLDVPFIEILNARSRPPRIIAPEAIRDLLPANTESSQVVSVRPGQRLAISGSVEVEVIPAFHGISAVDGYSDGATGQSGPRFVGYIIHCEQVSIYHSGDTIVTDELVASLQGKHIDVAILPINGRDYFREKRDIVGNMNAREAAQLATTIGAKTLIPIHWDLFRGNTERPGIVVDAMTDLGANIHVLVLGRLRQYRLAG